MVGLRRTSGHQTKAASTVSSRHAEALRVFLCLLLCLFRRRGSRTCKVRMGTRRRTAPQGVQALLRCLAEGGGDRRRAPIFWSAHDKKKKPALRTPWAPNAAQGRLGWAEPAEGGPLCTQFSDHASRRPLAGQDRACERPGPGWSFAPPIVATSPSLVVGPESSGGSQGSGRDGGRRGGSYQ